MYSNVCVYACAFLGCHRGTSWLKMEEIEGRTVVSFTSLSSSLFISPPFLTRSLHRRRKKGKSSYWCSRLCGAWRVTCARATQRPSCSIHQHAPSTGSDALQAKNTNTPQGPPTNKSSVDPPHPTTPCTLTPLNSFFTSCVKGQPELREAQLAVHYGSNRAHRHLCSGEMGLFCSQ